ncbi:MAG TPA: helix-turn-helix domain-containing protein [Blastocatellia bacterium]|nr:helix-turn-helix domain-containing protein [Blastocatellia bacterium]
MAKPVFRFAGDLIPYPDGQNGAPRRSPLADLVGARLREKGMRQIDFCRETGFDQGLLSKILSSVVNTLNVESALKLADGLNVDPSLVFEVIGKKEVHELLRKFYSSAGCGERAV